MAKKVIPLESFANVSVRDILLINLQNPPGWEIAFSENIVLDNDTGQKKDFVDVWDVPEENNMDDREN